jgi:hypothetical protein
LRLGSLKRFLEKPGTASHKPAPDWATLRSGPEEHLGVANRVEMEGIQFVSCKSLAPVRIRDSNYRSQHLASEVLQKGSDSAYRLGLVYKTPHEAAAASTP